MLSPLVDVWRHTFPKTLRFCPQCTVLNAQLTSIGKRYSDKRFIPRAEIQQVIDDWAPAPTRFIQLPVVRHVLLIRQVNALRCYRGEPSWLYTRSVELEHARLAEWFRVNATKMYIPKDQFEREVLQPFHVATAYHRVFYLTMGVVAAFVAFLVACDNSERILYLYLHFWRGMARAAIVDWFEAVMLQHCHSELPEAYKGTGMPPTAFTKDGDSAIYFNVVEMTSPDRDCRAVFIPHPRATTVEYCQHIGEVCKNCQAVVLEECSIEALKTTPPAYFFPLKSDTFPAVGLHHRYWDLVSDGREPPRLLAGSVQLPTAVKYFVGMVPFAIKTVYFPNTFLGNRGDARTGWGRIKESVGDKTLLSVAVPWTPFQITNLKCSLYRMGWRVTNTSSIPWMDPRQPGVTFCDHFGIVDESAAQRSVTPPA
jgi:hypothetical protein